MNWKSKIIIIFCLFFLTTSCYKPVFNKGNYKAKLTIFEQCDVPCSSCEVKITGKVYAGVQQKWYTLSEGTTDSNGIIILTHGQADEYYLYVNGKKYLAEYKILDQGVYAFTFILRANGASMPIYLNGFEQYTLTDTLYYKLMYGANNRLFQHGPFINGYIDTLDFGLNSISMIKDSINIQVNLLSTSNQLKWGKGKAAFDDSLQNGKEKWFMDFGCDVFPAIELE
jgi:hypothetical protein